MIWKYVKLFIMSNNKWYHFLNKMENVSALVSQSWGIWRYPPNNVFCHPYSVLKDLAFIVLFLCVLTVITSLKSCTFYDINYAEHHYGHELAILWKRISHFFLCWRCWKRHIVWLYVACKCLWLLLRWHLLFCCLKVEHFCAFVNCCWSRIFWWRCYWR